MNRASTIRLSLLIGLVVLVALLVRWVHQIPLARLASVVSIARISPGVTASPVESPTHSVFSSDRMARLMRGTVALQTFNGSTLVRAASGVLVSSDGLAVTTTSGAPYGSGSYTYQIATAQGAMVRARRVAYDAVSGLVLLRADGLNADAVPLDALFPVTTGDTLTVRGAMVTFSRYIPVIVPTSVVYTLPENNQVVLSVDRAQLPLLYGAQIVDGDGHMLGILRFGTTVGMIPAATIDIFVRRYLTTAH